MVKNDVVEKDVYNDKRKHFEDKIPNITNLATKTTLNAERNEVKSEIPSITNLVTKASLNAMKMKYLLLVVYSEKRTITQKLMKLKRKLLITIMINILLLKNLIS